MRQVAYHIWIKELIEGDYQEQEGWEPNLLHTGRGTVSRVNLIGTFLQMQGGSFLDDGTGQIQLRSFEETPGLTDAKQGDVVLVIGRPRLYQETLFIIPEVVRGVDKKWALVRKNELGDIKQYEKKPPKVEQVPPQPISENLAEKIVDIIAELDSGDGADIDAIVEKSGLGERAEEIVQQLLLDGEIFEIRPGILKVL